MRAGVPLPTIVGVDYLPAPLGDWLIMIDEAYRNFEMERTAKMFGAKK